MGEAAMKTAEDVGSPLKYEFQVRAPLGSRMSTLLKDRGETVRSLGFRSEGFRVVELWVVFQRMVTMTHGSCVPTGEPSGRWAGSLGHTGSRSGVAL
jgi:hypothetical protein